MNAVRIYRVECLDEYDLSQLLAESIYEGYRHVGRLIDEYGSGINRFEQEGEVLFVAIIGDAVAGVGGLNRESKALMKSAAIGRIRRVYVSPSYRRQGVASALIKAILAFSRLYYERVVLRTSNPDADLFYRSIGLNEVHDIDGVTHQLIIERNMTMEQTSIQHLVIFNLKHELGSAEAEKFLKDGERLLTSIPVVKEFNVFKQVSPKNDYDYGFSMVFSSQVDYETYNAHPVHVDFVENRWIPEVARFLEIDFQKYGV